MGGKLFEFGFNFGGSALKNDHVVGILHELEGLDKGRVGQHHVFKDVCAVHVLAIRWRAKARVAAFIHTFCEALQNPDIPNHLANLGHLEVLVE